MPIAIGVANSPVFLNSGIGGGVIPPPAAPTNLTATQNGADVGLAWTDNATNETGYKIYRSTDGVSYAEIDDIAAGSTSYTDLAPGLGAFYYYVAAYNGSGESASNTDNLLLNGYTVTTTASPETHTIQNLGVSASTAVYWGDGNSDAYTGAALRTHDYAIAGTYTVVIGEPSNVTAFDIRDNKVTLNSAEIAGITNVATFVALTLKAGTFDSADLVAWTSIVTFQLFSMPAGYAGTFDSADLVAWTSIVTFNLASMPAGYAGTFDSADVSGWNPVSFNIRAMPAGYLFTITANGFASFRACTVFQMQDNGLLQVDVDEILYDLYQAAVTPRTGTGGTINLGGTNAAPSGTFQPASACPVTGATDGKEVAWELLNDSCLEGFNKWTTITVTA